MQFEPLELHVVDSLGQQDVPDYFQQPAKAITEDVSVMRGPQAQGGSARKKARIVICGIFQEVHPDEFTACKTPSYPSLRMALYVSTAFLYARLYGDRDTDLGGNEIFMRPPKILIDTKVITEGVVWKIKKALYDLRTPPIAWETERDNTLKGLKWTHEETEYRLLPCHGSPCLWTVIPIRPGEDTSVENSKEELTRVWLSRTLMTSSP